MTFNMADKTLTFHNVPTFYREFTKNWIVKAKKEKKNPAEIAVIEDIHTLIEVALEVLEPAPTESEK